MMRHLLRRDGDTGPGDVFIANDPYGVRRAAPARHLRHQADLRRRRARGVRGDDGAPRGRRRHRARQHRRPRDGDLPGGLRLPLLKLHDAGVENETLLRIIEKNTRQPTQVLGDLHAQVAACRAGERGLVAARRAVRATRSAPTSSACRTLAERAMRAEIAALPDGDVRWHVDYVDGFGDDPEPIEIQRLRGDSRRRARDRLHRHERAGRREPQLPASA